MYALTTVMSSFAFNSMFMDKVGYLDIDDNASCPFW